MEQKIELNGCHYRIPEGIPDIRVFKTNRFTIENSFEFVPLEAFKLMEHSRQYKVILYKLIYYRGDGDIETIIPYYVSDGETNDLFADMLLPFMCVNNEVNEPICPLSFWNQQGLLYKIKTISNINLYLDNIIDNDEELKKININKSKGLGSVLGRMENLLDFIIAIHSNKITEYIIDVSNINNFIPVTKRANAIDEHQNRFRKLLLDHFKIYNINSLNFVTKTDCYVILNETTVQEFNRNQNVRICENNDIRQRSKDNYINYVQISRYFYDFVKNFVNSEPQDDSKEIYKDLLKSPENIKNICNTIEENIALWNATCSENIYFDRKTQLETERDRVITMYNNDPNVLVQSFVRVVKLRCDIFELVLNVINGINSYPPIEYLSEIKYFERMSKLLNSKLLLPTLEQDKITFFKELQKILLIVLINLRMFYVYIKKDYLYFKDILDADIKNSYYTIDELKKENLKWFAEQNRL